MGQLYFSNYFFFLITREKFVKTILKLLGVN